MFRVRYTAMRTILLRAPVAFQVVRFIATPHSYHPSILEKETSSVLYRTSTSVIRKALPFGSIPSWRAWTSTAIMAAPAGDDFKSTEWIGGEAHEVMPKVFLGSMVSFVVRVGSGDLAISSSGLRSCGETGPSTLAILVSVAARSLPGACGRFKPRVKMTTESLLRDI